MPLKWHNNSKIKTERTLMRKDEWYLRKFQKVNFAQTIKYTIYKHKELKYA